MNSKCVLAISGGMDSIALLDSLSKIIPPKNMVVAHFNHKTRGVYSDRDEAFVKKLSKKYQIKFASAKREQNKTDENSLRLERRKFLIEVARKNKIKIIITAHHAQDQLETLLMRLFRGTGLQGFRGIKELSVMQGVYFYRPLLKLTKNDIQKYIKKNNLPYVKDASNKEEKYFRNKIRKKLIPIFEELSYQFGGAEVLYQNILHLTKDLSDAHTYIELQIEKTFKEICEITNYWVKISLKKFLNLTEFEKVILLQYCFKKLNLEPLLKEQVQLLLTLIQSGKTKIMPAQDTLLTLSCGYLYIQTKEQQVKVRPKAPQGYRYIKPGDRVGSTKVKKILLEKKIPQPERRFALIKEVVL